MSRRLEQFGPFKVGMRVRLSAKGRQHSPKSSSAGVVMRIFSYGHNKASLRVHFDGCKTMSNVQWKPDSLEPEAPA